MLTTSKQMILDAQKGKYAVGCFNTSDLEITKAIIAAAVAQNSPVMVATSEKAIEYAGLETLAGIIKDEAEKAKVPVALHLDHGSSVKTVEQCLSASYTSVMIDGSSLNLSENITLTSQAVKLARAKNVPCEGELGHLGKAGQNPSQMTNPEDVGEFVEKTEVDFLAVSIGSQHGVGAAGSEKLDIELLKTINQKTSIPLVLHGASGVAEEDIRGAIQNGIAKVNIDTDIRLAYVKEIRDVLDKNPDEKDPRVILQRVMAEIQRLVEEKIKLFGSNSKV